MTFVRVYMPHVSTDIMGVLHNHIAILTPAWILNKRADNFGFSFLARPAMINPFLRDQRLQPGLQPIPLAGIRAFGKQLVYVANQVDSLFGFGSWLANSVSHVISLGILEKIFSQRTLAHLWMVLFHVAADCIWAI